MENRLLQVKKLSDSQIKTFWNRFATATCLFLYWIILFVACLLSDSSLNTDWHINLSLRHKGIFAYLFIFLLLPFIWGVSFEINKLFFGAYMKKSMILIFIGIMIFAFLPNIVYTTKFYYFTPILIDGFKATDSSLTSALTTIFSLFTITLIISFLFLLVILVFLIKKRGMNDFMTIVLFLSATCISAFGFFSIGFIGLLKSWLVLFFILTIVSLNDVFAYISGMIFGRHKMSKIISPKKTWEGFWIGLFITIMCGLLLTYFISFGENQHNAFENLIHIAAIYNDVYLRWASIIFLIVFLSIVGTLGDLFFSFIKRKYEIKDYSVLFKTHGGILDRFDSILFAVSAYAIFLFFLSAISDSELFA